jgi:hypothetical protein
MTTHTEHLEFKVMQKDTWNNLICQTYPSSKHMGLVTLLRPSVSEGYNYQPQNSVLCSLTTQSVSPLNAAKGKERKDQLHYICCKM